MRTESAAHYNPASSSAQAELTTELLQNRLHEDKQQVHARWFTIALFAGVIPFGITFASSFQPLSQFMMTDSLWDPPVTEEDMVLLDGAMIAPSVIMPILLGISLDAAWSVNLGLLVCLIGSVFGEFLVAMGIAWHSFGLLLTGRVVSGMSFGSIFVVAETIAVQFNRRRRATGIALILAVKTIAICLNRFWIQNFTIDSLQQDYEKMNDMMLIFALLCLGIGFLWTPLVDSLGMTDSPKDRFWKWHVPLPVWSLAASLALVAVFNTDIFLNRPGSAEWFALIFGSVILGPSLGYMLDRTDKSQAGSLSVCRWLLIISLLVFLGFVIDELSGLTAGSVFSAFGLGSLPMLIRAAVPQVASRDNISTSLGLTEGATFAAAACLGNISKPTFLSKLALLLPMMALFAYVRESLWAKFSAVHPSRSHYTAEPSHVRGA